MAFARARLSAKNELSVWGPNVLFSTGGYSAAPVVSAARSLGIPYVIHTADTVPAKSSRMFARQATAFTHVFRSTPTIAPGFNYTRTGHPLRRELRDAAQHVQRRSGHTVLVVGGSQGSEFLNEQVPEAATQLPEVRFLHGCGPKNLESTLNRVEKLGLTRYEVKPYFNTEEMLTAYQEANLVVARSGGTLAEIALFRIPSILVPLPTSADDHQLHNAEEFVEMKAASLLRQFAVDREQAVADADTLAFNIRSWLDDQNRRDEARQALADWDIPDATERIVKLIEQAAR
jgi:UDP-N-acetylglucosamine--N-acetylmuramyl-(pentapeptide) pyrophosphoryl-undecaprenol N-acetylglucosamine transferase